VSSTTERGQGPVAAESGLGFGRWWVMVLFEARLLARRRTTLLSVLSGPALMIVFALLQGPQNPAAWAVLGGLAGLVGLLTSTYMTATGVLTLRRESGVLSRQRTTELTGWQIVTAAVFPLFAVGVAQALAALAVYVALGAPSPQRPDLVLLGLLLGGVLCAAAAALTCTVSSSAEGVQFAAMPLLLAAAIGANILSSGASDDVRSAMLLIPGTASADLVTRGWVGASPELVTLPLPMPVVLADVVLLAAWTVLLAGSAAARWCWTSRG
jgi:ABC-2 type transport system permease protein